MNIFIILIVVVFLSAILWKLASQKLPCPVWLACLVELDNPFARENRAKTIIDHIELNPGMRVLDAGCGPGRLTIPLAQKVGPQGEITALDIQRGMLERVKEKAQAVDLNNIKYVNADLGEGKLEHNYYDCVVLVTVLGEIPDQQKALQEIFHALKFGGILSITETIFDPHYQRSAKVIQLAESIGFKKKKMFGNWLAYTLHLEKF